MQSRAALLIMSSLYKSFERFAPAMTRIRGLFERFSND
nr:MAG TPA: hypothetical protein [Caudoviricetes sp.]